MGKQRPKRQTLRLLASLLLVILVYVGWCVARPLAAIRPTVSFKPTTSSVHNVNLSWPGYGEGAIGAIGYNVLAVHGNQTPLPTASIAKVITALAVLQQRPLRLGDQGPAITINQQDIDSYNKYVDENGSVVKVSLGEQLSEYQALEALLLPSANNMADTLARWAFGSIDAYTSYANDYTRGLGLHSVKVTDPSGFLPTTVASAQDLTTVGELALQNPIIAQIAALPSATIPVEGTVTNYNFLLGKDGNVGLKTGNNNQDLGAYLFAYTVPVGDSNVLVVGTLMGGPSLTRVMEDAHSLVQSARQYFKQITYVHSGDVIAAYKPAGQSQVQAMAAANLTLIAWEGHAFTTTSQLRTVGGAAASGTAVGTVQVSDTADHSQTSVAVVLTHDIRTPSLLYRLTHPF